MSLYRDQAVVLRTWKLGEADRIVSMLTRDHGKVRGVAKGVRRTKSKFGARLEPTSHVAIQLYEGKSDLHTITQVETINRFVNLRLDPDLFAKAESMLESVEQIAQDHDPAPEVHNMLWRALATLDAGDSQLIAPAFFLKLLAHDGVQPQLDECISCESTEDLVAFDVIGGGVLCHACRRDRPISYEALDLMRRVYRGELAGVLREDHGEVVREVDAIATALMEAHLERRLRSVTVGGQLRLDRFGDTPS